MEVIEPQEASQPREMTPRELVIYRLRSWWYRHISRRVPRLVWIGDEIDVSVHFQGIASLGGDPARLFDIERTLYDLGVHFDTGSGWEGRDWEWDWSLSGPIHVKFRGHAKHPENRCPPPPPPELKLVS